MKKILAIIAGFGLLVGTRGYSQVSVSYSGGLEESGGSILNSDLSPFDNTAVGIFVASGEFDVASFTETFNADAFNTAILEGSIVILNTAVTGLTQLGEESLILPAGSFQSGTITASGLGQVYIFATNGSAALNADWEFDMGGIWTNTEWVISSEATQFELNIDLSAANQSIYGSLVQTGETPIRIDAVLAPALAPIPEPSTYALMMMGVALGYTIYRRRKQG